MGPEARSAVIQEAYGGKPALLGRLLASAAVIAASSFVVFWLVAASGDPLADLRIGEVPPETLALRESQLHLDRSIPMRYAIWVAGVVNGDLGQTVAGEPVAQDLGRSLTVTLRLVVGAAVVATILAVAVGTISAVRQYSWLDHGLTVTTFALLAMPVFWLGHLVMDLAVELNRAVGVRVFFVAGERTPDLSAGLLTTIGDRLGHLVLPVVVLSLVTMAEWARFLRASMLDVLNSDYVRTARAKGLSERRVVGHHALRTAIVPFATVSSLNIGRLLGGAVITETVFGWHGMGRLLLDGLRTFDTNLVTAWLLVAATAVVAVNLITDLALARVDPRIGRG